ncbi:MAG: sel1 repeat family protein, partial [Muribaculaceae bacterium]|nr:sel1 repeat family protein [Muribaculaceae bacterium]
AEQGNAWAQNNLGDCYYNGRGVDQNYDEAVKWYRKAAKQGNAPAQYNLGYCYYNGHGVDKNYDEAVNWYRKAAEQGYNLAKSALNAIIQQ